MTPSFLVLGAGAIGSLIGARLALAGHAVTLVGREPLRAAVEREGLTLVTGGEPLCTRRPTVVTDTAAAFADGQRYDWVFLTTKAHDAVAAAAELHAASPAPLPIVTMQNGVGSEARVADVLGGSRVVAGTLTTPVEVEGPARFATVDKGGIGLARWTPRAPDPAPLAAALTGAGVRARLYEDARAIKWSKLLLNMIGNATSAILGWPPGRILADPRLYDVELDALEEAQAVMRAEGVATVSLPGYPVPLQFAALRRLPRALTRPVMARLVASGRGGKMPSLYLALVAGRRESEVTVLNGAVAEHGARLGVPVPVNRTLTRLVLDLAHGVADPVDVRDRPDRLLDAVDRARREEA